MTSRSLTERSPAILPSASSRDCSRAEVEEVDCSRKEEDDSRREEEEPEAGRSELMIRSPSLWKTVFAFDPDLGTSSKRKKRENVGILEEKKGGEGGLPKSHFFSDLTKCFFCMPKSF